MAWTLWFICCIAITGGVAGLAYQDNVKDGNEDEAHGMAFIAALISVGILSGLSAFFAFLGTIEP